MEKVWDIVKRPRPIILANKANAAVIERSPDESAARLNAEESSSGGADKLTDLAGMLFRSKDENVGYQDYHRVWMGKMKKEIHGINDNKNFPPVSRTRYQSKSYAAAELIVFLDLYIQLIEHVTNGKTKGAGMNHVEKNVHAGLNDIPTITELAALALYGVFVSWPYLSIARGGTEKRLVNLIEPSMVSLHRHIPGFCTHIAANPALIFDPKTPLDKLTLDGQPVLNCMIIAAVDVLRPELPDLFPIISGLFRGCAKGWVRFMPEFSVGGPIDQLTPAQRKKIFIPATNDHNEGALGSNRVYDRGHPSATSETFSSIERVKRNKTEEFAQELCDEEDMEYVMHAVRAHDASGSTAKFREELIALRDENSALSLEKTAALANKRRLELDRLISIPVETDRNVVNSMTVKQLKDQLDIYRKVVKDAVVCTTPAKEFPNRPQKLVAVLAALTRYETRQDASLESRSNVHPTLLRLASLDSTLAVKTISVAT